MPNTSSTSATEAPPASKFYLLNSAIITDYGEWRMRGPLSHDEARTLLPEAFISAIRHQGTCNVLHKVLNVNVPLADHPVCLKAGDAAIVLRLMGRLPMGSELTASQVEAVGYELALLERIS